MTPSPIATERAAPVERTVARRWHTHGWNRPLAWELILRIPPALPRFLHVPLHHLTTLVCFAYMRNERAAAGRNLRRITGATGLANLRTAYRLFYNFSRFLVAYGPMRNLRPEQLRARLNGAEPARREIRRVLDEGRGVVLATMHMGQWDVGLKLLSEFDVPVHVVVQTEASREVARYADESRLWERLKVHQVGSSPLLAVELMAALKRGEVVAIQMDRAVGSNVMRVPLFGAETELPTGPVQLAMATGAPLLPVFVLLDRGLSYRVLVLPPLPLPLPSALARRREEHAATDLPAAMRCMAAAMEAVVSQYPDQWFSFYDVWPA